MASRAKKALRAMVEKIPTEILVEEFIARFEDGMIDIPLDQIMEPDEDGLVTIKVLVKEYD